MALELRETLAVRPERVEVVGREHRREDRDEHEGEGDRRAEPEHPSGLAARLEHGRERPPHARQPRPLRERVGLGARTDGHQYRILGSM